MPKNRNKTTLYIKNNGIRTVVTQLCGSRHLFQTDVTMTKFSRQIFHDTKNCDKYFITVILGQKLHDKMFYDNCYHDTCYRDRWYRHLLPRQMVHHQRPKSAEAPP